jgi:UDP-N-acetylmuramoyl-tripeptide--D-alanyl-D-alanine ligase
MFELTLGEIAYATGGELVGPKELVVSDLSTDSRNCKAGDLFAAIVGEHFDGHEMVFEAVTKGAVAAITSKPVQYPHVLVTGNLDLDPVISALGKLAKYVRLRNPELTVIGITGSSGKTSTKDLIGQVLLAHGKTYAPVGSPNNELGLPQTILQAPKNTEYLVAEMGMRGLGHIDYLVDIAKPNISIVTNVGHAHIGEVGSIEKIALAKSEIVRKLSASDFAILNFDDPLVRAMASETKAKIINYGLSTKADISAQDLETHSSGATSFKLLFKNESANVDLPIPGEHNVINALAAAAVGLTLGMQLSEIAKALGTVSIKSKWRMEVSQLPNSITLINDTYNANPESMMAALKTLASMQTTGRRWAVLGAMHELGDETIAEHDRVGRQVVRLNIDQLVVVGQLAKPLHMGAEQEGSWDGESVWFPDFDQADDYINKRVASNDVLLFKASRSEQFDRLAEQVATSIKAKGELA